MLAFHHARLRIKSFSERWSAHQVVFGNVFWLVLEKALTVGFVLACDALLARSLSVSEFGQWQYALNLASLLGCIGFVAGAEVIVPALARHLSIRSEIISAGAIVRIAFALLTVLISLVICQVVVSDPVVRQLTVMAVVIVVVNEAAAICTAYFQATINMRPVAARRLATLAVRAVLFYGASRYIANAEFFAVIRWIESAILCLLLALLVSRHGIKWRPNKRVVRIVLFRGIKFLPPIIMMYAFTRIDRIYIERYLSFASVATYSVAQQFVEQCFMLITIVIQTLAPRYIYSSRTSSDLFQRSAKIAGFLVGLSCAMIAGTWLLGDRFIILVFGERYAGATDFMYVLILSTIPFAIDSVITQVLLRGKAAGYLLLKWSIMVAVAIGVYQFIIPVIGVAYLRYVFLLNFCCMAITSILVLMLYQRRSGKLR